MRAYGTKYHHHNLPDVHPKKPYVNWWEVEIDPVGSKKRERQKGKEQIRKELGYGNSETRDMGINSPVHHKEN